MSKRRYSQIFNGSETIERQLGAHDDGAQYWRNNLVILAKGRPQRMRMSKSSTSDGLDDGEERMTGSTPEDDEGDTMAAHVFAEAVQALADVDGEGGQLFFVDGDLAEVQSSFDSVDASEGSENTKAVPIPILEKSIFTAETASPAPPATKVFETAHSHLYGSPERIIEREDDRDTLHQPASPSAGSSSFPITAAPLLTSLKSTTFARPRLARLDTSERVATLDTSAIIRPARRKTSSGPRLNLSTTTMTSGVIPLQPSRLQDRMTRVGLDESVGGPEDSRVHAFRRAEVDTSSFVDIPIHTPYSPSAFDPVSFEPSEILSNFLYLGPEIVTFSEVEHLKNRWGIKRILNAAWEIEDGGGKHLSLDKEEISGIQKYKKIPLKDSIEAKGVQAYMEEACTFLDDAKLHSAPVYVHCKAGKSRSVMLVMAYLIHSNRWSLEKSYSYVVEKRKTVSPNIGFMAELMTFEETSLQTRRRGPISRIEKGSNGNKGLEKGNDEDRDQYPEKNGRRSFRDSMPTQLGQQLSPYPPPQQRSCHHQKGETPRWGQAHPQDGQVQHWQEKSRSEVALGFGKDASEEIRGLDGRYYSKRPPADARLLAPFRRATLAGIDSENKFGTS
ncbi:hypothetical protein CBS101457_003499 [Exobasidium rhododendri]|nr:hypothetical protein CBS101457_003499 [Exobasidium rhododendri]